MSTSSRLAERESAVRAVDTTCPRCGTARTAVHRYCLECGLGLPQVTGSLAAFRRTWLRRVGWYPGDWAGLALATFLVAAATTTAAIVLAGGHRTAHPIPVALDQVMVTTPPKASASSTQLASWPRRQSGWTIVLGTYPKTVGRAVARAAALTASGSSLPRIGLFDSSLAASLQPGYFVVFSGIYPTQDDADAALTTARQAGFVGAYSAAITR